MVRWYQVSKYVNMFFRISFTRYLDVLYWVSGFAVSVGGFDG